MKRKLIAFALIFAMLASLSPAVAADEMSATPTVEEILNEYSDGTLSDLVAEVITDTAEKSYLFLNEIGCTPNYEA